MLDHPYAEFLMRVERPGRYVGGEFGAATVPEQADLRLALAFPDLYEIGMSHIGLAVLYEVMNRCQGVSAERVFMPWPDLEARLVAAGVPLVSLESARPLRDFHAIGFSLQYELTYTNLLAMLDLGGVPRRAANRSERDPLVLVGGPLAVQCEPLAPFVDLALIGDGEQALPELATALIDAGREGLNRAETIARAAKLPAVYSPSRLEREHDAGSGRLVVTGDGPVARRAIVERLADQAPGCGPVATVAAVFDRYSIEIARGCAEGCRFCQAGFLYRPVRERSEADVDAAVEKAISGLGFDEVSLAALSSADHSRIDPLVRQLGERYTARRVSLSVPSLRAYGLSDELVEIIGRLRASGVTLAPEAGSQRLRDAINKNVSEDELLDAAARFFAHGFHRIKLYFMLGLPGEEDRDIEEIARLAIAVRDQGRGRLRKRRPEVVVSVSNFVPKPHTPFEREPMVADEELRRRQELLRQAIGRSGLELRLHDQRLSRMEAIFSRGDVRLADVLERAVDLGARFDGWGERFDSAIWRRAIEGFDDTGAIAGLPDDARVPWDHVDVGVSREFLLAERDDSRRGMTTAPCGRFETGAGAELDLVCHACGLECDLDSLPLRPGRPERGDQRDRSIEVSAGVDRIAGRSAAEGEVVRCRVTLARWGRQAYVGHLDAMRQVVRSLRRAGLSLLYTSGYHPRPKLEAGPPLPLGTAGLAEPIDIWLLDPPREDELLGRLSGVVPADMEFVSIAKLKAADPKLSKAIKGAEYVLLAPIEKQVARAAVERLVGAESFFVERVRKGRTRRVDVRGPITEFRVADQIPTGLRVPADPRRVALEMEISLEQPGSVRPGELLRVLVDDPELDVWVTRTRLVLT